MKYENVNKQLGEVKIRNANLELHKKFVEFARKNNKPIGRFYSDLIADFLEKTVSKINPKLELKEIFLIRYKNTFSISEKVNIILDWLTQINLAEYLDQNEKSKELTDNRWKYIVTRTQYDFISKDMKKIFKDMKRVKNIEKSMKSTYIPVEDTNFESELERYNKDRHLIVWVIDRETYQDIAIGEVDGISAIVIEKVIKYFENKIALTNRNSDEYQKNIAIWSYRLNELNKRKNYLIALVDNIANELLGHNEI